MDFLSTGLPEKSIFTTAFTAGWQRYVALFLGDEAAAYREYMRGPLSMARMIHEKGGDCRQVAVAACLAGPSLFSAHPDSGLDKRLYEFMSEVQCVETVPTLDIHGMAGQLSGDARLFLQVSAVVLLDRLAGDDELAYDERQRNYFEAVELYSVVRGAKDTYSLDIAFEVAALKVRDVLDNKIPVLDAMRHEIARSAVM